MKVAITGGIGSGKSYVCRALEKHGIRVYDCDAAAKRLMRSDAQLQADLMRLVGDEVYVDGVLQKPVLSMRWFILLWLVTSSRATTIGSKVPSSSRVDSSIAPILMWWSVSRLPLKFACIGGCSETISPKRRRGSG